MQPFSSVQDTHNQTYLIEQEGKKHKFHVMGLSWTLLIGV